MPIKCIQDYLTIFGQMNIVSKIFKYIHAYFHLLNTLPNIRTVSETIKSGPVGKLLSSYGLGMAASSIFLRSVRREFEEDHV